jgi:hypothetical protein
LVDGERCAAPHTSIGLDRAENIHISYIDKDSATLLYATRRNGTWLGEFVDTQVNVDNHPLIHVDWGNNENIYYWGSDGFRHARRSTNAWEISNSFSDSSIINHVSISVDQIDYPHLSYNTWEGGDVKYAHLPAPAHDISISKSRAHYYGLPGETVTTTLAIRNSGTETDRYDLAIAGNLWPVVTPTTLGPLESGECETIEVLVSIPPTASLGSSDTATITLTSQSDPNITATATLTTYAAITTYLLLVER